MPPAPSPPQGFPMGQWLLFSPSVLLTPFCEMKCRAHSLTWWEQEGKERGFPGRPGVCKTSGNVHFIHNSVDEQKGTKKPRFYRPRWQTPCPSLPFNTAPSSEPNWGDRIVPKGAQTCFNAAPSLHGPVHGWVELGEAVISRDGSHGYVTSHSQALRNFPSPLCLFASITYTGRKISVTNQCKASALY